MYKKEETETKEAIDETEVTVKCMDCGHRFVSKPRDWPWEDDTIGSPFPYPPECPKCNSTETIHDMTDVERAEMCKREGIGGGAVAPPSNS